eukprot:964721_1
MELYPGQDEEHKSFSQSSSVPRVNVAEYGRLIKLIRRLRDAGVESHISLPRTVIVGMQSSGKSSLVENLSGVELPRGSNKCTSLPTEMRLLRAEEGKPFEGSVKVCWGKENGQADKARWVANTDQLLTDFTGDFSSNESIRIDSTESIKKTIENVTQRIMGKNPPGFSDSRIVLQITHHSVNNFEVLDTPGIVETLKDVTDAEIQHLKEMVMDYMRDQNTIILVAMECTGDPANLKLLNYVKDADPTQERTKLILTKADLIELDDEKRWVDILRGIGPWAECAKVHGCSAVSSRTPTELLNGASSAECEARERNLFHGGAWCSAEPALLGSANLKGEACRLLGNLMKKSLPEILKNAKQGLKEAIEGLEALPETIPDTNEGRSQMLYRFVVQFLDDVSELFELAPVANNRWKMYSEKIAALNEKLAAELLGTQPPRVYLEDVQPGTLVDAFVCDSEWISTEVTSMNGDNAVLKGYAGEFSMTLIAQNGTYSSDPEKMREAPAAPFWSPEFRLYESHVRAMVIESRARLLPGVTPNCVLPCLIGEVVSQWRIPSLDYAQSVYEILDGGLGQVLNDTLADMPKVQGKLKQMLKDLLQKKVEKSLRSVKDLLDANSNPFSMNGGKSLELRTRALGRLVKYMFSEEKVIERFTTLNCQQLQVNSFANLKQNHPKIVTMLQQEMLSDMTKDNTAEILTVIASAQAYSQLAYARFIDDVPMFVDMHMLRGLYTEMKASFVPALLTLDPEKVSDLLNEDSAVSSKRAVLIKKRDSLKTVVDELSMSF